MELDGIEANQETVNMEEIITINDEMHISSCLHAAVPVFVERPPAGSRFACLREAPPCGTKAGHGGVNRAWGLVIRESE